MGGGVTEVIATSGDPRLGGNDWDRAIANWLEQQFVAEHGVRISAFGRRRLLDAAEEAKVALSAETSVEVEVAGLVGTKGLSLTLSRRKMEAITRPLLLKLVAPMLEVASMARVDGASSMAWRGHPHAADANPSTHYRLTPDDDARRRGRWKERTHFFCSRARRTKATQRSKPWPRRSSPFTLISVSPLRTPCSCAAPVADATTQASSPSEAVFAANSRPIGPFEKVHAMRVGSRSSVSRFTGFSKNDVRSSTTTSPRRARRSPAPLRSRRSSALLDRARLTHPCISAVARARVGR